MRGGCADHVASWPLAVKRQKKLYLTLIRLGSSKKNLEILKALQLKKV